jgi:hypothetical protein
MILNSRWIALTYAGFIPFVGLLFEQGWYGIGLGTIVWPLVLIGFIVGFGSSIIVMIYGSWKQRLIVAIPFLYYAFLFVGPLL